MPCKFGFSITYMQAHNRSLLLAIHLTELFFFAWLLLLKAFDCVMANITVLSPRKDKERPDSLNAPCVSQL
jgi:hypothetical protein